MNLSDLMSQEFQHEASITRKCLERIPEDKFSYKPHDKSMSMIQLGTHLANLITWSDTIINSDHFDMASSPPQPEIPKTTAELLEMFDRNMEEFKQHLAGKPDSELFKNWQLKNGDNVMLEMPKAACVRGFIISHSVHHRGQLSVYLRENDVPVPAIYGPSADEDM